MTYLNDQKTKLFLSQGSASEKRIPKVSSLNRNVKVRSMQSSQSSIDGGGDEQLLDF